MLSTFCKVVLKSGPCRIHFQYSGAKLRGFEQNTDIIKFCCRRQEQPAKSRICYYACITCM